MAQTKQEIRKKIKQLKTRLTPISKTAEARAVFGTVEALRAFRNASNVMLYASLPDELPTEDVLPRWAKEKNVFLPRVKGNDIEIVKLDSDLHTGAFGIKEPAGEAVNPTCLDLIIVPAIALDGHCNRLGRGRGYYDRLLASCKAFTIGVAFDVQFVDEVPTESHDIPLCGVVTPSHVSFRKSYTAYQTELTNK